MSSGFTSVVLVGSGVTLSRSVLVCAEFASDGEFGKIGGLFEAQKGGSGKIFFGMWSPSNMG